MLEKEIFDFVFEKFEDKKVKINISDFVAELSATKYKLEEILKPLLIDKRGYENFNKILTNEEKKSEKDFLEFTYLLLMVWNFYTELEDEDRKLILEYLNN